MKRILLKPSRTFLICLFSVFLIGAGISRYLETDSGNILIHDIDLENYEGFLYKGRLFRPLQASSMNQRPGILLIFGDASDRYTGDHIAMELARRGFVALTIEDFSHGMTDPEPAETTENLIDAGYTFLSTRTFTDHERIGLLTFCSGADKIFSAANFSEFASRVFVSPKASVDVPKSDNDRVFSAAYETSPTYRPDSDHSVQSVFFPSSHAGMIFHSSIIAAILEHFHESLSIPNDSPLWFDASSQKAQMLLILRFSLLILMVTFCSSLSVLISGKADHFSLRSVLSILIPLLFLLVVEEFMNFFIVSVRLGSPFNYLPRISQLSRSLSPIMCLLIILFSFIGSISIGKSGNWMITDCLAVLSFGICLCGFLPIFFGNKSGWEFLNISGYRYFVCLVTILTLFNSFLLRLSGKKNISRCCCAVLNGLIFYWICSNLPLHVLFQE